MIEKKLKELYSVDTLSQDKGWQIIYDKLKDIKEDIKIDFTYITVIEPWKLPSFQELIKMPNVYFKFTNNDKLVDKLKMLFIMEGFDVNRLENIVVEVPRAKTSEELKIERGGEDLLPCFKVDGTKANINLSEKYTQLGNTNTINYIKYAIDKLNKEQGVNEFLIKFGNISAMNSVLEYFAEVEYNYSKEGITIIFDIDNPENINSMGLFRHKIRNNNYDLRSKILYIKRYLQAHPYMPGMLIQYKKSRALDEFGRQGKGEKIMSRISVIRSIDGGVVTIDTYNSNYFYTNQHWIVTHDNQPLDGLRCDTKKIKVEELGFCNEFLGTKYHFIEAIQQSESESTKVIYGITDTGANISKLCTIPERMKFVFNDWGIQYNKEMLERAIKLSAERINNTSNI